MSTAPQPSVVPVATTQVSPASARPPLPRPLPLPPSKPTPLDPAGQRTAHAYLAALGQGRKATVAKDYGAADLAFGRCLELVPNDPRAMSERGYARLLADRLPEAKSDLLAARSRAPSVALELQILHNLILASKRTGDERAQRAWEDEKRRLEAARRMPDGTQCVSDITRGGLEPRRLDSFDAVMKLVLAEHKQAEPGSDQAVAFSEPYGDGDYPVRLEALRKVQPFPDGFHVLWTSGAEGYRNHAVIAEAGRFYVYPNLSAGYVPLCGFEGLAEVTIAGGGPTPWRLIRETRSLVRGYRCADESGSCVEKTDGSTPALMGFCSWTGTDIDVTVLDAKTFRGILTLTASVQPIKDDDVDAPARVLDLDWGVDHVMVRACGRRQRVPYLAPQ